MIFLDLYHDQQYSHKLGLPLLSAFSFLSLTFGNHPPEIRTLGTFHNFRPKTRFAYALQLETAKDKAVKGACCFTPKTWMRRHFMFPPLKPEGCARFSSEEGGGNQQPSKLIYPRPPLRIFSLKVNRCYFAGRPIVMKEVMEKENV